MVDQEVRVVAKRGVVGRYAYWSDRRIRRIAAENDVSLSPKWGITTRLRIAPFLPELEFNRRPQDLRRGTIAERIERLIGESAVEDFITPPPAEYAKGVGRVTFAHLAGAGIERARDGVVMHVAAHSSEGKRVAVCLFGSVENLADYIGASDKPPEGWSSSASHTVETFIRSRGTVNESQWDDPESLSVEALRIALHQGAIEENQYHRGRPWTRGFTLGHADESEWLAEIYSDVILTKGRWLFRDDDDLKVDRILIGAPLWIRTPKPQSVYRYMADRSRLDQMGALEG